jgi:hypothetical protein
VDFFSWHYYTDNSDLMTEIASNVRAKLDSAGMAAVSQHVSEWNICMNCNEQDTAEGAAATVSTMIRMVRSGSLKGLPGIILSYSRVPRTPNTTITSY